MSLVESVESVDVLAATARLSQRSAEGQKARASYAGELTSDDGSPQGQKGALHQSATKKFQDLNQGTMLCVSDVKKMQKRAVEHTVWTQSTKFQSIVGIAIIANAIVLGLEVDHGDEWASTFGVLDHIFTVIFLGEVIFRFKIEGIRTYFSDSHSVLDFVIVLVGIVDVWILRSIGERSSSLRPMTMLRLVRLVRLVRVIRVFSIFKELAIIAQSFAAGGRTLFWGGVFVGLVVYVFGIFAVDFFGRASDCEDAEDGAARILKPKKTTGGGEVDVSGNNTGSSDGCEDIYDFGTTGDQFSLFGSLDRAMLTLYMCATDGCGSDIVYKMVYKTPWVLVYWYFFVFITSFGLVNVMVGLFCENVFAKAQQNEKDMAAVHNDRREKVLNHAKRAFEKMDADGSRAISRQEFEQALQHDPEVESIFEELELDDNVQLFDVLDVDRGGVLTIDEFFEGLLLFMNGNEPAKVKDSIGTYLIVRAIFAKVRKMNKKLNRFLGGNADEKVIQTSPPISERTISKEARTISKESEIGTVPDWVRSLHEKIDVLQGSVKDIGRRQASLESLVHRTLAQVDQEFDSIPPQPFVHSVPL